MQNKDSTRVYHSLSLYRHGFLYYFNAKTLSSSDSSRSNWLAEIIFKKKEKKKPLKGSIVTIALSASTVLQQWTDLFITHQIGIFGFIY